MSRCQAEANLVASAQKVQRRPNSSAVPANLEKSRHELGGNESAILITMPVFSDQLPPDVSSPTLYRTKPVREEIPPIDGLPRMRCRLLRDLISYDVFYTSYFLSVFFGRFLLVIFYSSIAVILINYDVLELFFIYSSRFLSQPFSIVMFPII